MHPLLVMRGARSQVVALDLLCEWEMHSLLAKSLPEILLTSREVNGIIV